MKCTNHLAIGAAMTALLRAEMSEEVEAAGFNQSDVQTYDRVPTKWIIDCIRDERYTLFRNGNLGTMEIQLGGNCWFLGFLAVLSIVESEWDVQVVDRTSGHSVLELE